MSNDVIERTARYDIVADYYDLNYGAKAPSDVPFYLELAAQCGGPVLELGCGTGRVGLELARAGYPVVGLDISPAMLGAYKRKLEGENADVRQRVELVEGSMASFGLGRQFALIIVPFRAFQHLLTPVVQRACLTAVRDHLTDGGCFVYDAFNPDVEYIADRVRRGATWRYDNDVTVPEDGRLIRRSYYANPDTKKQTHDLWFRYEEFDAQGTLLRTRIETLPMRWQYRWEAEYLLELCGLQIEEAYGSYLKTPLDDGGNELIFVCRRR